jgi:hypothetical protein
VSNVCIVERPSPSIRLSSSQLSQINKVHPARVEVLTWIKLGNSASMRDNFWIDVIGATVE